MAIAPIIRGAFVGATLALAAGVAQAATPDDGQRAYDLRDYDEARKIWEALAQAGNPQAQFGLGLIYGLGNGVAQDQAAAYRWYRRAAESGLAAAEFNVAVMADSGRGVRRDPASAALWYAKAAAHGHNRARYNIGQLYEAGDGVPGNPDQAAAWFRAAAGGGLSAASEKLKATSAKETSRQASLKSALPAPVLIAPADRAQIEASANPASVELVWDAPPQPAPVTFFIEMLRIDRGTPQEVFAGYSDQSAILAPGELDPGTYAWRVYAVSQTAAHYTVSAWHVFSLDRVMRTVNTN